MYLPTVVVVLVAAFVTLRVVERRHAARKAERQTALRRLREQPPVQPNALESRRLTSFRQDGAA